MTSFRGLISFPLGYSTIEHHCIAQIWLLTFFIFFVQSMSTKLMLHSLWSLPRVFLENWMGEDRVDLRNHWEELDWIFSHSDKSDTILYTRLNLEDSAYLFESQKIWTHNFLLHMKIVIVSSNKYIPQLVLLV